MKDDYDGDDDDDPKAMAKTKTIHNHHLLLHHWHKSSQTCCIPLHDLPPANAPTSDQ